MARQSNADRLKQIHAEALEEFDAIQAAVRDQRLQALDDRRFYSIAGAQWEGALGEQFANKPRFEFNQVHLGVIRIISEYRNNRITVDFQPKDGSDDDEMADVCDGLYRADEQASTATEAYDNAFEEAVGGGFGAWRLRARYEDEEDDEDERQRIEIEPIFDADSTVFFDLDSQRQDKSDAQRAYVLKPYTRAAYIAAYDDDPQAWDRSINRTEFDWCTPDVVYVCEHYRVDEVSETIQVWRGLDGSEQRVPKSELDDDPERLETLQATGFRLAREKKVKRKKVRKYLLSGGKVLEDCGYIAGRCIPIVPVYGKRWVVDGIERMMGHVRLAKDAQRLHNMLMSWLAEMAARFDVEKPILTPEQIAGHAVMWAEDNIKKYPYLLINPVMDASGQEVPGGPVGYTKAPNVPPAMAALAQLAQQALQDLLGAQQAGEQLQPNQSGKAVELIQNRLDMQVFIYMSNLSKAMKRSGEIWLSMMKDIAVEESRRMKTVTASGETGSVVLNEPAYDPEKGVEFTRNDMSATSYDVAVDVGPSSSSLRSAVVRALTGIAAVTEDPTTKQALTLGTISNLEGEGLRDLRDWARRQAVRMGLVKPTDAEREEMAQEAAGQQPDPQSQYLMAAAEQAEAEAAQNRAKTVQTIADAELKRAQTGKTIAETMGQQHSQELATAEFMRSLLQPQGQTVQ